MLSGVTNAKLAELVYDCYGVRLRHIRKVYSGIKELKSDMDDLVANKFVREVDGMYYPGGGFLELVSSKDGSSIADLRKGVEHAIYEDNCRPVGKRFLHTDHVNDVLMMLKKDFFRVCGEARLVLDLPLRPEISSGRKKTQLKPDGFVYAAGPFGPGVYIIEFERSAVDPDDILDKLEPWELAIGNEYQLRGMFVLENPDVEQRYIKAIGNLPLLTTTIQDVKTGPLSGNLSIWRRQGQPVKFETL